jgi:hypothetical protein
MTQKLSRLDWGVVGTGFIALIALFLPWYGASYNDGAGLTFSSSISGFSTSYGWLGGLLIVAAGVVLFLHRFQTVNLSKSPVGPAVIVFGLSIIGTVIVILRWLTLPRGGGGVSGIASYSYGPRVGIILAVIVGIIQAVCGFLLFRASGEAMPWAAASAAPGAGAPPPGSMAPGTPPPSPMAPDTMAPGGPPMTPPPAPPGAGPIDPSAGPMPGSGPVDPGSSSTI